MNTLTSKDGTRIAYDQLGGGPPLVIVDGAMCRRKFGPSSSLAPLLAPHFTVFNYDRRGRGDSGDTQPYSVEREIEDLAAIVDAAGGSAFVYGSSSGAALAMRAAASGVRARKLVLHEPPYALDESASPLLASYRGRIAELLAADRRGDAVALFMKVVGVPAFGVFMMRLMPNVWPKLKAAAHTLPYDFAQLGDTPGRPLSRELQDVMRAVKAPTLMVLGGKSPDWMRRAVEVVASAIPGAKLATVPGQNHAIAAKAIAPVLIEFFS
jgi:alpha-beta hydrolase superfamily lysophospholipase